MDLATFSDMQFITGDDFEDAMKSAHRLVGALYDQKIEALDSIQNLRIQLA